MVVAAVGLTAVGKAAGKKSGCGLICIAGDPGIDFDAGLLQCLDGSTADAAASDNALSPWLWAGIAVVAACALTALGVYRVRLARKDAQAEADQ